MKVYIQRISDHRYYAGDGHWCKDRACALKYPHTIAAFNEAFYVVKGFKTELVIALHGNESFDIRLSGPKPLQFRKTAPGL